MHTYIIRGHLFRGGWGDVAIVNAATQVDAVASLLATDRPAVNAQRSSEWLVTELSSDPGVVFTHIGG